MGQEDLLQSESKAIHSARDHTEILPATSNNPRPGLEDAIFDHE